MGSRPAGRLKTIHCTIPAASVDWGASPASASSKGPLTAPHTLKRLSTVSFDIEPPVWPSTSHSIRGAEVTGHRTPASAGAGVGGMPESTASASQPSCWGITSRRPGPSRRPDFPLPPSSGKKCRTTLTGRAAAEPTPGLEPGTPSLRARYLRPVWPG